MAAISEIFHQIFCDKEQFAQYMAAMAQHQEVEFFARQGCIVTQEELDTYRQQWQNPPGYHPAVKPLSQCPPFSEADFFACLSQWGCSARQPGEEEQVLHFID